MNAAKIQFSEDELQLVENAGWVLTKNKIIVKVYEVFGQLAADLQQALQTATLPTELLAMPPKISRGENYQGLPYVMLDYPRFFTREHIFAVRTFFWWGNYFSVTLHLKGKYKTMFLEKMQQNSERLAESGYHINVSGEEWKHELHADHFISLSGIDAKTILAISEKQSFLKLVAKVDFPQWNQSDRALENLLDELLRALQD